MGVAAFGRKPHLMILEFAALCRGAATSAANILRPGLSDEIK